jgi:hypothetical protein
MKKSVCHGNARCLFVAFFLAWWIPGWIAWAEEAQAPQFLLGADVSALGSGVRNCNAAAHSPRKLIACFMFN